MPKTSTYYYYRTPYGYLTIAVKNGAIYSIKLGKVAMDGTETPTELSNTCATELLEYFAGKRFTFDLPIAPEGSDFQQEVWRAVEKIPYGQTQTSSDIALAMGRPNSFRMVGAAVKENPLIVLIPTHRIVGKNGSVNGSDRQARVRAALLEMEQRYAQEMSS